MKTLARSEREDPTFDDSGKDLAFAPRVLDRAITKNPRVGCAGIIRRGTEVLLGRRNKEPNRGLWVLPGGGVGFGETLADTLRRELYEEAGIEIQVDGIFNVH